MPPLWHSSNPSCYKDCHDCNVWRSIMKSLRRLTLLFYRAKWNQESSHFSRNSCRHRRRGSAQSLLGALRRILEFLSLCLGRILINSWRSASWASLNVPTHYIADFPVNKPTYRRVMLNLHTCSQPFFDIGGFFSWLDCHVTRVSSDSDIMTIHPQSWSIRHWLCMTNPARTTWELIKCSQYILLLITSCDPNVASQHYRYLRDQRYVR